MTKKNDNINAMGMGMVPPQAVDVEVSLLGTLIMSEDAVPLVAAILKPDHFYKDTHKTIYRAIMNMYSRSADIDLVTVVQELRSVGDLDHVGGAHYISTLSDRFVPAEHAESHAYIIFQQWMKRELISAGHEMMRRGYEDTTDVFDLLDRAEERLYKINSAASGGAAEHIGDILVDVHRDIESAINANTTITGVPSKIQGIDRVTAGWQPTDLIILAARPGMGKTALALHLAKQAASEGYPVGFCSLEMSKKQLVSRLLASEANITNENLKRGNLTESDFPSMNSAIGVLERLPIYIDDDSAINLFELRAKARKFVSKHNIKILFIDYVQLMSGTGKNREEVVSNISRGLKALAKDLEIPIMALGQLNRSPEIRGGDKKPIVSDLRESGSLEQDADMVLFMWSPEYYNIEYQDRDGRDVPDGYTEVIIAKHRNGRLGIVPTVFTKKYSQFEDYEIYIQHLTI